MVHDVIYDGCRHVDEGFDATGLLKVGQGMELTSRFPVSFVP